MAEQVGHVATKELRAYLTDRPEVTSLQGLKPVKLSNQSWVFTTRINNEKVVVKRFFEFGETRKVQGLKQELDYLEEVFGAGNCQANKCLMAWPDDGVVVLSFVPGQRLDNKISTSKGQQRGRLLTHSGEWLRRYIQPRQRRNSFAPSFWINKLAKLGIDHVSDPVELALLEQVMAALQAQSKSVRGCDVVQAATHGDYAGINAHFHKNVIYGVDIQGESWLPVAKDVARFLIWLQIHDKNRPAQRRSGIARADWDAFLASGVLSEGEQTTTLPFFVGAQLYERFVENYHRGAIRQNTRAAIERYLAG